MSSSKFIKFGTTPRVDYLDFIVELISRCSILGVCSKMPKGLLCQNFHLPPNFTGGVGDPADVPTLASDATLADVATHNTDSLCKDIHTAAIATLTAWLLEILGDYALPLWVDNHGYSKVTIKEYMVFIHTAWGTM